MKDQKEKTILAHIINDPTIISELNLKTEMFSELGQIIYNHANTYNDIKESVLIDEVGDHLDEYLDIINHYDPESTEIVSKLFIQQFNTDIHIQASYKHYIRLNEGKILPDESLRQLINDVENSVEAQIDKLKTRISDIRKLRDNFANQDVNIIDNGIQTWIDNYGYILPNKLMYYGAKPGTGKTQVLLEEMYNIATNGHVCVFFSLEMPEEICNLRLLAIHLGMPFYALELAYYGQSIIGEETMKLVYDGLSIIADLNIIIVDDVYYLSDIELTAKKYFRKYKTVYTGIDYAQLIRIQTKFDREDLKNAHISERLARLRKDTNTICVLSQVNDNNRLRGGGWDQAADDIIILSRDQTDIEDLVEDSTDQDAIKYGMVATIKKSRSKGYITGKSFLNQMINGRYSEAKPTTNNNNVPF